MLHRRLLSKHSRSGEHHSRTHLTIPDEPETSQILSTNPELACSPLNPKTRYVQPRSGFARTLSLHSSQLSLIPFLSYLLLSVHPYPCLVLSCHSFLRQPCIQLVLTIPSRTFTHLSLPLRLHPDHSFQVPVSSTSSISSLRTPCIP